MTVRPAGTAARAGSNGRPVDKGSPARLSLRIRKSAGRPRILPGVRGVYRL